MAPASNKVAKLFCRSSFADAEVSMGFERGTGWNMSDEEQMEEVEQRVRAGKPSEDKHENLVEQCVTHFKFCFRMYDVRDRARCGKIVLA